MEPTSSQFAAFSLNCWGLKYVSKQRKQRIAAIADYLAASEYDVVGLQEVWVQEDYQLIRHVTAQRFPFAKYFYSGILGSGLVVLSRHRIISSSFHRYSLNGKFLNVLHGDYFSGKCVGSVCIQHPACGIIEVFNTHLHANYIKCETIYGAHRAAQAWELATLIRRSKGSHVFLLGDLNSTPDSLEYQILTQHAGLTDAWATAHPSPGRLETIAPAEAIEHLGVTCDSPLNAFTSTSCKDDVGKRIDYIMCKGMGEGIRCQSAEVLLVSPTEAGLQMSDHFGVAARVLLPPLAKNNSTFELDPRNTGLSQETLRNLRILLGSRRSLAEENYRFSSRFTLFWALLDLLLLLCIILTHQLAAQTPASLAVIILASLFLVLATAATIVNVFGWLGELNEERSALREIEEEICFVEEWVKRRDE
ncbi:uncharacterized protein VTP21DRAFT_1399 [Calcarisporiella thermophila]|uniref:uncharacterized protein n=1 Tax=Calcarisporiella thermophila TaxID=911321 RepID=UPI0037434330